MTAKTANAATTLMTGAIRNTTLSARAGTMSSLSISLMGSARACNRPQGPTRIGPRRACMKARTFRSKYTRKATRPDSTRKTMTIFMVASSRGELRTNSSVFSSMI